MAETIVTPTLTLSIFTSIILFFVAAITEIGGGYLVWKWIRERKGIVFGVSGGSHITTPLILGGYAVYGGIFIISAVIWGVLVDKKKPDRDKVMGSITAILGAIIIFYAPR